MAGLTGAGVALPPRGNGLSQMRLTSVDVLRGAVMVLMAIDHVRVYAGVPPGGPTPGVFFTRWVTHFCAPVFVFLAGSSAFLGGQKMSSRMELTRWLVSRGLILVLVELTYLRFVWTFNADWMNYNVANVIWAIGWSMMLLGALVHLPLWAIAAFGALIVLGHNAAAPWIRSLASAEAPLRPFLSVLYTGGGFRIGSGGPRFIVLYSLIPWVGVMALGYGFGAVLRRPASGRDRWCMAIGLGSVLAFVALRGTGVYGDPTDFRRIPAAILPPLLAFLNPAKYPASLQFLLMTIGPAILLIPLLERARGRIVEWLTLFGREPFFYYLLHIPLIHVLAIFVAVARTPDATAWLFGNHPMSPPDVPPGYAWNLTLLYLVTTIAVVLLYVACRWYSRAKSRSAIPLLRYF